MSPEQARGDRGIDLRTDIYSCAVMLYEMLAGEVPFDAENIYGVLYKIVHQDFPSLQVNSVDEPIRLAIADVLRTAVAKDREQRYASAADFQAALENVGAERTSAHGTIGHATTILSLPSASAPDRRTSWRRRPPVLVAAAAGLTAVASLAYLVRPSDPSLAPGSEPQTVPSPADIASAPIATQPSVAPSESSPGPSGALPVADPPISPPLEPAATTMETAVPSAEDAAPSPQTTLAKDEVLVPAAKSGPLDQRARAVVERGLKTVRPAIDACGRSYALGDTVDVVFEIAPDGSVAASAAKAPHQSSPLGNCVATAVQRAKFSFARKPQKVTRRFSF